MICNSDLSEMDVKTAKAAAMAVTQEWKIEIDKLYSERLQKRLFHLYELLQNGKLEVRILPDFAFGLVHGKAGVITYQEWYTNLFFM